MQNQIQTVGPAQPASQIPVTVATEALEQEVEQLADALAARFEELSLIHDLSESLTLDDDPTNITKSLLGELSPCVRASALAILLEADEDAGSENSMEFIGQEFPQDWLMRVSDEAEAESFRVAGGKSIVSIVNSLKLLNGEQLRIIVVPISQKSNRLGRMVAIRSMQQPEFGTIEADLMKSTSMMLGVHLINQRQYVELQNMFEGAIQSLVSALDAKDAYTCGHSERVSDLTVELAKRVGYDEEDLARVRMGGILHDIGKIGIDDAVLRKPGRLTDEEFEKIKEHPVLGYEILKGVRQFRSILPAVRHHHECWDGSGYPDGLVGDEIPRDAQIMAVADAFDAMTSDRPYRSGMPLEKVIGIFLDGRGKQWAADVVDTLLSMPEVMERYASREAEMT